jgi:hypothetical protein
MVFSGLESQLDEIKGNKRSRAVKILRTVGVLEIAMYGAKPCDNRSDKRKATGGTRSPAPEPALYGTGMVT